MNEEELEALRTSIEHVIPKSRGALFIELISAMAHDPSWEEQLDCPARSLTPECPESEGQCCDRHGRGTDQPPQTPLSLAAVLRTAAKQGRAGGVSPLVVDQRADIQQLRARGSRSSRGA